MNNVFLKRVRRKLITIIKTPLNYIRAKRFLNYAMSIKSDEESVIVLSALIGDTVYALAYLDEIKKQNSEKNICVVGGIKQEKLLKCYPQIDRLILLEDGKVYGDLKEFIVNNRFSEIGLKKNIINGNAFFYRKCYQSQHPDIMYQLKTYIYKVGENADITYHQKDTTVKVNSIKNFESTKNRIVILNPYSHSAFESTFTTYEKICNFLINEGYIVFTNVVGNQTAVKGSLDLRCSIEELYEISCHIPLIVSIRSGILDYLAASDINMFVIYENCSNRIKEMYHLNNWKSRGKIKEVYPGDNGYTYKDIMSDLQEFVFEIKALEN